MFILFTVQAELIFIQVNSYFSLNEIVVRSFIEFYFIIMLFVNFCFIESFSFMRLSLIIFVSEFELFIAIYSRFVTKIVFISLFSLFTLIILHFIAVSL
jgi:hypothetical protein